MWTPHEQNRLYELVTAQASNSSSSAIRIDWDVVGAALNRTPGACSRRYGSLQRRQLPRQEIGATNQKTVKLKTKIIYT